MFWSIAPAKVSANSQHQLLTMCMHESLGDFISQPLRLLAETTDMCREKPSLWCPVLFDFLTYRIHEHDNIMPQSLRTICNTDMITEMVKKTIDITGINYLDLKISLFMGWLWWEDWLVIIFPLTIKQMVFNLAFHNFFLLIYIEILYYNIL